MALEGNIPTSNRTPGLFLTVSFGVGPQRAEGPRKVLLYGNKQSSGSATDEVATQLTSLNDAEAKFGPKSELYHMARAAFAAHKGVPLHAVPIAESAGTNASEDWTFSGTATSAGTVRVRVNDIVLRVPYDSGDAAADVATAVEAAVNDHTTIPVTPSVTTATLTLTYTHPGPRGDEVRATVDVISGAGITVTASADTGFLDGGATLDDGQNALDAVAPSRYHYHISPNIDGTELEKWVTHVEDNADPTEGRREVVLSGSVDDQSTTETLATGRNAARLWIVASEGSPYTPGMMAAAAAAYLSLKHSAADVAYNPIGDTVPGVPAPWDEADYWTANEITSLLNNGVTPLQPNDDGDMTLVRPVTSKSQDGSSNPDYRTSDIHKVTVPDFVADDLAANWQTEFGNMSADDDDPNGEPPPAGVATPSMVEDWVYSRMVLHEQDGLVVNVEETRDQIVAQLDASPAGRFTVSVPCDVVEWMAQGDVNIRQVG